MNHYSNCTSCGHHKSDCGCNSHKHHSHSQCSSCDEVCPVQLDTSCVFYNHFSSLPNGLPCLGLPNGTALSKVLEALDSKLCEVQETNFNSFNLPFLRYDSNVQNIEEFAQVVDNKMGGLSEAMLASNESFTDITTTTNETVAEIQFPELDIIWDSGIEVGDSITIILQKILNQIGIIINNTFEDDDEPLNLTVTDSTSIDLSLSGTNLTASTKISPDAGNIISVHSNGLFAVAPTHTPQALSFNSTTKVISLSGGGGTITLPVDSDIQSLAFNPGTSVLSLTDGGSVDLSPLSQGDPTVPIVGNSSQSITITPSGSFGHTLIASARIDSDPDNALSVSADGLFAENTDELVKSNADDTLAGYLEDKLLGLPSDCVVTNISTNPTTFQQEVTVTINKACLAAFILDEIIDQPALRTILCSEIQNCIGASTLDFGVPSYLNTTRITSFKVNTVEQLSGSTNLLDLQLPIGTVNLELTVQSGYDAHMPRHIVIINKLTGAQLACTNYVSGQFTYTFPSIAITALGIMVTTLPGTC